MFWDADKADDEPGAMQFGTVEAHNASNGIFLVVTDDGMKSFINKDGVEAAKDEWERSDKKSVLKHFMRLSKREGLEQESIPRLEESSSSEEEDEEAEEAGSGNESSGSKSGSKAAEAKAKAAKVKAAKTKTKQQALEAQ